jgi:hypothetical protein
MKPFVLLLEGKTLFETSDESVPVTYIVGQGLVINEEPLLVVGVKEVALRVEVTLALQSAHPELFCSTCEGSLGVTTNRHQCQRRRKGNCEKPKKD